MADGTSDYYQYTSRVPLAGRVSLAARRRVFGRFLEVFRPGPETTVLDLGATGDVSRRESNFLEQWYPWPDRITCVGEEGGSSLLRAFPAVRYVQVTPGEPLPFDAGTFDLVFSHAVIEHVGSRAQQAAFVQEARRVGWQVFITTPDRWFPVETHTAVPLAHYLPAPAHRRILRGLGLGFYATEERLNLLTAGDLRQVAGPGWAQLERVRLWGVTTNLLLHGPGLGAGQPAIRP